MLRVPETLNSITHPLIASMYLKQDFGSRDQEKNVLVIQASLPDPDDDYEAFDTYLMDLLLDLESLKNRAENCVGPFERIDIRTR